MAVWLLFVVLHLVSTSISISTATSTSTSTPPHLDAIYDLLCQLRSVIEEQLLVNLLPEAMEDSDTFRNESLYTEACDSVLQVWLPVCLAV